MDKIYLKLAHPLLFIAFSVSLHTLIYFSGGKKSLLYLLTLLHYLFPGIYAFLFEKIHPSIFKIPRIKSLGKNYLIFSSIPLFTIALGGILQLHEVETKIPLLTEPLKQYLQSHGISEEKFIFFLLFSAFFLFPFLLLFITVPLEIGWRSLLFKENNDEKKKMILSFLWSIYFFPPYFLEEGFLPAIISSMNYFILGLLLAETYLQEKKILSSSFSLSTFYSISSILPLFCKNFNPLISGSMGVMGLLTLSAFACFFYLKKRREKTKIS